MTQDFWHAEFKSRYYKFTGVIPSIVNGSIPAKDLAIVEHVGFSREYWLTYPIEKFDSDYWSVFFARFARQDHLRLNLSTALVLSETIFGPEVYEMDIPDIWVLSIEVLPEDCGSRII